jgi:hypothetical protein
LDAHPDPNIAGLLPTDYKETTTVLTMVHEMIDEMNKPHSAKPQRRRPHKAAGK